MGGGGAAGRVGCAGAGETESEIAGSEANWTSDADRVFDRRCCGAISGMVEERRAIFVGAAAEKDQVRSANTGHGCRAIAVAWHGCARMGQRGGAFSRRGRELICAGELRRSDARNGSGTPGLGTTT